MDLESSCYELSLNISIGVAPYELLICANLTQVFMQVTCMLTFKNQVEKKVNWLEKCYWIKVNSFLYRFEKNYTGLNCERIYSVELVEKRMCNFSAFCNTLWQTCYFIRIFLSGMPIILHINLASFFSGSEKVLEINLCLYLTSVRKLLLWYILPGLWATHRSPRYSIMFIDGTYTGRIWLMRVSNEVLGWEWIVRF